MPASPSSDYRKEFGFLLRIDRFFLYSSRRNPLRVWMAYYLLSQAGKDFIIFYLTHVEGPFISRAFHPALIAPHRATRLPVVLLRGWILSVSVFALLVGGLVQPRPLSSQTTPDFFLHGAGATANPPTLFLDATAPTATTEKYKDSTSLNFSGGNLWKEVGTWPAAPTLTAGTLSALTDLHVWLGLQNSNDQGTSFDLLAELYKNGALVTSGLTRCITGVTRNPSLAKE